MERGDVEKGVVLMGKFLFVDSRLIHHKTEKAILLEVPVRYHNMRWGIWIPKVFTNVNKDGSKLEFKLPDDFKYNLVTIGVNNIYNSTGDEGDIFDWEVSEEEFEKFMDEFYINIMIHRHTNEELKQFTKEVRELVRNYDLTLKNIDNLQNLSQTPSLKLLAKDLSEEDIETMEKMKHVIRRIYNKAEQGFKVIRLPGE